MKNFHPHKYFFLLLACLARLAAAQCDSTPPLLEPAFTLYGDSVNQNFGTYIYFIHDTSAHAHMFVNVGVSDWAMRDYSRFNSQQDTAYRCCLPYPYAVERYTAGNKYPDYIVHQIHVNEDDSIFFIPGSPQGIWSQRRWLLMTSAYDAQMTVGKFFDSTSQAIVIADDNRGTPGTIGYRPGQIWIWRYIDSSHLSPDIIFVGDTSKYSTTLMGRAISSADLDHDGIEDLCVSSGGGNMPAGTLNYGATIFWGGPDFPNQQTQWSDRGDELGWEFDSDPFVLDVTRDGIPDLVFGVHVTHDTVWGEDRQGYRDYVFAGVRNRAQFDTIPSMILRPAEGSDRTCIPGSYQFGKPISVVSDINGDNQPDYFIGAPTNSFGNPEALLLYLGGNQFDTIPDAYFPGATSAIGGIDWNNDGIGDFIVPRPDIPGVGYYDYPAGAVQFFAGSRSLRSFGVTTAVHQQNIPSENYLNIFPQPVRAVAELTVHVAPSLQENTRLQIFDMLGRAVIPSQTIFANGTISVSLGAMPAGEYHAVLRSGMNVVVQGFVHVE